MSTPREWQPPEIDTETRLNLFISCTTLLDEDFLFVILFFLYKTFVLFWGAYHAVSTVPYPGQVRNSSSHQRNSKNSWLRISEMEKNWESKNQVHHVFRNRINLKSSLSFHSRFPGNYSYISWHIQTSIYPPSEDYADQSATITLLSRLAPRICGQFFVTDFVCR
jgi:hypothetical protein